MAYDVYTQTSLLTLGSVDIGTLDFGGIDAAGQTVTDTSDGTGDGSNILGDFSDDTFDVNGTTYEYAGVATDDSGNPIGFIGYKPGVLNVLLSEYALIVPEGTPVDSSLSIGLIGDNTGDESTQWDIAAEEPVCFAAGTLISTPDGTKAVETLEIGDLVMTADGREVSVKWIGRQTVHKFMSSVHRQPVLVRKNALGAGKPNRDLVLTASHALIIDGLAINAGALVNNTTIDYVPTKDLAPEAIYYHVETAEHDVIMANGTEAETYVDYAKRTEFDNYAEYVELYGAERQIAEMTPLRISTRRLVPTAIRERLGIQDSLELKVA